MINSTNPRRRTLAVGATVAVIAAIGVYGLAHATLGLYQTPGTQYMGHWVWNDAATDTSEVDVRVKAVPLHTKVPANGLGCARNLKIEVTGVAADGSSQTKSALVQVPSGFIRQVTIPFDHQLTQLTFIKILSLGAGQSCGPA